MATLVCRRFLVRFEGETFDTGRRVILFVGGSYQVDGRPGGSNTAGLKPSGTTEPNGFGRTYFPRERKLQIFFKSHQINYRHYENTLQIGGQKFSTAPNFLALTIQKNGRVRRERLPAKIVTSKMPYDLEVWDWWPNAPRK